MCGITGWIEWNKDLTQQEPILEKMIATLAARGPDDYGKWLSQLAAIGHRRLVVVDPQGGAQPMLRNRNGNNYVISYNGELYNTEEIRRDLLKRGYVFKGYSDTEVFLYSYMEWGSSCVERLNGIFAVAVWDEFEQKLFLSRDRMGVKPLFYYQQGTTFLFGSEIKALLAHPEVKPIIKQDGLIETLIMCPARTPGHGIFTNIKEVKPGWSLIYNRNGIKNIQYWKLSSKYHKDDLNTTTEYLKYLFKDTVERQLVSDVPVCTLLSGGLDSSAISAVASIALQKNISRSLHSYSIDYKDNDKHFKASDFQPNADKPWVEKVSAYLGTIHHTIVIDTPQLVSALREATLAKDLPGMADVDSSLYLFCCEVKKEATVALSGECADEILGGYPWFLDPESFTIPMFPWVRHLEDRISLWKEELFTEINPLDYIRERYNETISQTPCLHEESYLDKKRRELFFINIIWFMSTLLDRKDRMSMATGLEVRVPFSDHRLVEYIWNIPWKMKMHDNMTKGILRRALQGILPADVLKRKKSPYPKTFNPNYYNAVKEWLSRIIDDSQSPLHMIINEQQIKNLLRSESDIFERPFFGQLMKGPQLFAYLIQLNIWLKEYNVQLK